VSVGKDEHVHHLAIMHSHEALGQLLCSGRDPWAMPDGPIHPIERVDSATRIIARNPAGYGPDMAVRPSTHGDPRGARRVFLSLFPDGFADERYLAWERDYKVEAHRMWLDEIGPKPEFRAKLDAGRHAEVAAAAVRVESSRALLFSFEKMALRDAVVKSAAGGERFAEGLFDWLHGPGGEQARFERWIETIDGLPRKQTRVLTWPTATVFGFVARPRTHLFVKPLTIKRAAAEYGFDLAYASRPNWDTYSQVLALGRQVLRDLDDLGPRDLIDAQSFLWILGSDEYAEERDAAA
jgi:hypothetical protein